MLRVVDALENRCSHMEEFMVSSYQHLSSSLSSHPSNPIGTTNVAGRSPAAPTATKIDPILTFQHGRGKGANGKGAHSHPSHSGRLTTDDLKYQQEDAESDGAKSILSLSSLPSPHRTSVPSRHPHPLYTKPTSRYLSHPVVQPSRSTEALLEDNRRLDREIQHEERKLFGKESGKERERATADEMMWKREKEELMGKINVS